MRDLRGVTEGRRGIEGDWFRDSSRVFEKGSQHASRDCLDLLTERVEWS